MLTSDFDYELPANLIAQEPLSERDSSRMMVVNRKTGKIVHLTFKRFSEYVDPGGVVVLNTSRVIPAKAWGKKGESAVEFLFLREKGKNIWEVLCRPARKVREKDIISFFPGFRAEVIGIESEGKRILRFSSGDIITKLRKIGYAPLPPYIRRKREDDHLRLYDLERYQTVFANKGTSVAAPTAGLHFTSEMLEQIERKGARIARLSLDVGLATFQPVRTASVENHRMSEEQYSISKPTAATINHARKEEKPVTAVGTTSVRALESSFRKGKIQHGSSSTDLFIYPGYEFKAIDRLLTNFHLPRSSLLMLVSAFADLNLIRDAYDEAVRHRYRFFSYGDCMLIL